MSTLSLFDRLSDEDEAQEEPVYRVAAINRLVRLTLEDSWGSIWVEGELSDVRRAASGHVYFTLNDDNDPAQLRGVMFRSDARRAKARLADGQRARLRGSLSLFEPRGSFQIIARVALPGGDGDLHAQFERVRKKLAAEGLMDVERKRPLPSMPKVIGVVSSAQGAAIHDIIRVASVRCPCRIVVSPCLVQGKEAPRSIVAALEAIQKLPGLDVVIVGRGGGSAEDLCAFNDEQVARAVAACRAPTVSAVGHEVDVSVSDLVADVRAATPSNAAELVVPDRGVLVSELRSRQRALQRAMEYQLGRKRLALQRLERRIFDPRSALGGVRARFHELHQRLARAMQRHARRQQGELQRLHSEVLRHDPRRALARDRAALSELYGRLRHEARRDLTARRNALEQATGGLQACARSLTQERRAQLGRAAASLQALSPLSILARGYAIALHEGKAITDAAQVQVGDPVKLRLHRGALHARVEDRDEINAEEEP